MALNEDAKRESHLPATRSSVPARRSIEGEFLPNEAGQEAPKKLQPTLTYEEAIALYDTKFWEDMRSPDLVKFQLFEPRLTMPLNVFHKAIIEVMGESKSNSVSFLYKPAQIQREYLGGKPVPTFNERMALLPERALDMLYSVSPERVIVEPPKVGFTDRVKAGIQKLSDALSTDKGHPGNHLSGHADPRLLGTVAGVSASGILAKGAVAAFSHAMPAGIENGFQQHAASLVMERADLDLHNHKLNQAQYDFIKDSTAKAVQTATAASLVPADPGISSDKAIHVADKNLVETLVKSGLSARQAAQYEMGSAIGAIEKVGEIYSDHADNITRINHAMQQDGKVHLSTALNINQADMQWFAAKSEVLGDKSLKLELSRDDRFKDIAHFPEKDIRQLANLANTGIDPYVTVDAKGITPLSQAPKLSKNPEEAFQQAALYIVNSGDSTYRVPQNSPKEVQATVAAFATLHGKLSADGALSKQDYEALIRAAETVSTEIAQNNAQGIVANWEAEKQTQLKGPLPSTASAEIETSPIDNANQMVR